MKIRIDNMWNNKADVILATTNNVINNGRLVMGAGSALEMKQRHPAAPRLFSTKIEEVGDPDYGTIILDELGIGAFQTKRDFRSNSNIPLIEKSVACLKQWCADNPNKSVFLPFPGIGFGGLTIRQVLPAIILLSDQVTVFTPKISAGLTFVDSYDHLWVVEEWNCNLNSWMCKTSRRDVAYFQSSKVKELIEKSHEISRCS